MTVITGIIAVPDWVPLEREHWKLLAALGLFGAIGQSLLTEAFRSAPPSVVAPFEYTALIWGIGIDWVVWSVLPASRVYVGGGIVIASGLYLIWHESQQREFDKSCASTPAP
jgi:drug/metabolite transporter (DMT)-like permease